MDRDRIVRERRRREALDAIELEQTREEALRERLEQTIADAEGWRADRLVLPQLSEEDAEALRELNFDTAPPDDETRERFEEEIAEIERDLEACELRKAALERYAEALARTPIPASPEEVVDDRR